MTGAQPPSRRVAVTAPRRNRSGGWSARAGAQDLHAQPRLGQIYLRALVRDQLRLALGVLAVLAVVLGGLPLAFALLPGLRTAEITGIRLPWLLLGAVAYPVMVGAAWFHVRHAERVERDFTDMLNAPGAAGPEVPAVGAAPEAGAGPAAGAAEAAAVPDGGGGPGAPEAESEAAAGGPRSTADAVDDEGRRDARPGAPAGER
ncbi:hypothetical protein [Streptomyces sp. NPDC020917]|uniref:hypothetical protein n=1 Tax=Streptomyces sp. NPDC020917 TaxID=3365102 RepID=UPI0037B14E39